MQIKKKFIANNAVDGTKIFLANLQSLRGRNNANNADLNIGRISSTDKWEFQMEPQWASAPTGGSSLVNRDYVLDVLAGIRDPKDACQLATTADINLASAPATIDGIAPSNGWRILVKNQTDAEDNGIYVYNGAANAMTRATDFDSDAEVTNGASTLITGGNTNARKIYILTTSDPIVVGTTALVFVQGPNPANFLVPVREKFDLSLSDITNQYIDLSNEALEPSVQVFAEGVYQTEDEDYDLSVAGSVTRITFDGDLATGGAAELAENDKISVHYSYETN